MFDTNWHLARSEDDTQITNFELQLWQVFYAFLRWQEQCEQTIHSNNLTGYDLSILHMIRMKDKPKTIYELCWLFNRDDAFAISYSIKKLLKMQLITKTPITDGKRNIRYQVTNKGIDNTNLYAQVRQKVLVSIFCQEIKLEEITKSLSKIKTIYDQAAQNIVAYGKTTSTNNN